MEDANFMIGGTSKDHSLPLYQVGTHLQFHAWIEREYFTSPKLDIWIELAVSGTSISPLFYMNFY